MVVIVKLWEMRELVEQQCKLTLSEAKTRSEELEKKKQLFEKWKKYDQTSDIFGKIKSEIAVLLQKIIQELATLKEAKKIAKEVLDEVECFEAQPEEEDAVRDWAIEQFQQLRSQMERLEEITQKQKATKKGTMEAMNALQVAANPALKEEKETKAQKLMEASAALKAAAESWKTAPMWVIREWGETIQELKKERAMITKETKSQATQISKLIKEALGKAASQLSDKEKSDFESVIAELTKVEEKATEILKDLQKKESQPEDDEAAREWNIEKAYDIAKKSEKLSELILKIEDEQTRSLEIRDRIQALRTKN